MDNQKGLILRQVKALVWKQYKTQTRQWRVALLDYIIPFNLVITSFIITMSLPAPVHQGEKDDFLYIFQYVHILFIYIVWYLPTKRILNEATLEKETRIKETLSFNNMRPISQVLSVLAFYQVFTFISMFGYTLFGFTTYIIAYFYRIYFVILFAIFLFSNAIIAFTVCITALFNDFKLVSQIGNLIFIMPLLIIIAFYDSALIYPFILIPHIPFYLIMTSCYSQMQSEQEYRQDPTLFTINTVTSFLVLMIIIPGYLMLYLYLDQIIANKNGISKKCCFCIKNRRQQIKNENNINISTDISSSNSEQLLLLQNAIINNVNESQLIEESPIINIKRKQGIEIRNLRKTYGQVESLKDITLNINKNEVFTLLGPNGSGKTTLIQCICGFIKPTSGAITVNGESINENIDKLRKYFGFCQQYDIIINSLTVYEHLYLISQLNDVPKEHINQEIDQVLSIINLKEAKDKYADLLSLGMKRKLQLGIALIGRQKKFLVIDEVTSGLDMNTRKEVWSAIKNLRGEKTIILCTQHLEEADELSDRICILNEGKIEYLDSAFNFKRKFGVGIHLQITTDSIDEEQRSRIANQLERNNCNSDGLKTIDQCYEVIINKQQLDHLYKIVKGIEETEGIKEVNIVKSELEEAFLNFLAKDEFNKQDNLEILQEFQKIKPRKDFKKQFSAIFLSRAKRFTRHRLLLFLTFLPVFQCLLSVIKYNLQLTEYTANWYKVVICSLTLIYLTLGVIQFTGVQILAIIVEKESRMRYLITLTGINQICYWLGNFAFDFMIYFPVILTFVTSLQFFELFESVPFFKTFIVFLIATMAFMNMAYLIGLEFQTANQSLKLTSSAFILLLVFLEISMFLTFFLIAIEVTYIIEFYNPFYFMSCYLLGQTIAGQLYPDLFIMQGQFGIYLAILLFQFILYTFVFYTRDKYRSNLFRKQTGVKPDEIIQFHIDPTKEQEIQPNEQALIRVKDIHQVFKMLNPKKICKRWLKFHILKGITVDFEDNQIIGLVGPNGAGKSTFLEIISLQSQRTFGDLEVMKQKSKDFNLSQNGNKIGVVSQYDSFWEDLTVEENLHFFGRILGFTDEEIKIKGNFLKSQLDLEKYKDYQAFTLSGGNKRKLSLCLALLGSPKILILDEPFTGVDPVSKMRIYFILKNLKDTLIILSSHRIDEIQTLCDQIVLMENGQVTKKNITNKIISLNETGYKVIIQVAKENNYLDYINQQIIDELPILQKEAVLGDSNSGDMLLIQYKIKDGERDYNGKDEEVKSYESDIQHRSETFRLSEILQKLQKMKEHRMIQEYEVSKSSNFKIY